MSDSYNANGISLANFRFERKLQAKTSIGMFKTAFATGIASILGMAVAYALSNPESPVVVSNKSVESTPATGRTENGRVKTLEAEEIPADDGVTRQRPDWPHANWSI